MLLVDGNNVIGSRPDGWWRDRAGATRRLVEALGMLGKPVTVVFDGRPVPDLPVLPGVEVRFAERRGPDAADDVIAELAGPDTTVVTSDAALAARARARGATVIGARALRDRLDDR